MERSERAGALYGEGWEILVDTGMPVAMARTWRLIDLPAREEAASWLAFQNPFGVPGTPEFSANTMSSRGLFSTSGEAVRAGFD